MFVRENQVDALAAPNMDRAKRDALLGLNGPSYSVVEQPANTFLVRDLAGQTATVQSRGLQTRVVSPEGRVIEFEQYAGGKIRRIVDAGGRNVQFVRDRDGLLTSIERGPEGGAYHFLLTPDSKPLSIAYPDGTVSSAQYTPEGNPATITNRDGSQLHYEYLPDGSLTRLTDPRGRSIRISYEGPNSRTIEYPNGDRHSYTEDADAPRQRFLVNGELRAVYQDDPAARGFEAIYSDRTRERFLFVDGRVREAINDRATVTFEYDVAGRLISEQTNGALVRYLRNETGALVGIVTSQGEKISFSRDHDQRLTGITDWTGAKYELRLPPVGPPGEIRYPNGVTVTTRVNAMGLPSEWNVVQPCAPQGVLDSAAWQHDLCDRLTEAVRNGRKLQYRYNAAGRVIAVQGPDSAATENFDLDLCGNRIWSADGPCSYDSVNRLVRQGNREFVYDRLGNVIEDRQPSRAVKYTYNGRGLLVKVQTPGVTVEYGYDALGRRIFKRSRGVTVSYEWAGTRLLAETADNGVSCVRRDYLFCPEFLSPLAFREGPSVFYMHNGRRQEPLLVTDRNGKPVWSAEYLAFGGAVVSGAQVHQPLRLPGQYYDDETGLHYSVSRYYSPELGRFLSMDPQRKPGLSLNYYISCDGDPVNRLDPTGEISLTLGTVLVAVGIGIAVGAAIGAGVELYKERNEEKTDWGQVGRAGLVGGAIGGIGAAVGVVAEAALVGAIGIMGAGAAAGGLGAAAEQCVQNIGSGNWNSTEFVTSVAVGAAIGAVTAGIGGVIAARAARRAAQEAADRAAKEAAERAARNAASEATKAASEGELSAAGRSLTKHAKGQRAGSSAFPEIKGSPKAINAKASEVLDGIMNDPAKLVKLRPGKGGQQIMQVSRPDGTGAIFKQQNGQWVFSHFAENLY